MAVSINNSGTFVEAQQIFVNDSGTWRSIKKVQVNDNGTWRTVFPESLNFSSATIGVQTVTVPAGLFEVVVSVYAAGGGGGSAVHTGDLFG
jgi:hypothetical protein